MQRYVFASLEVKKYSISKDLHELVVVGVSWCWLVSVGGGWCSLDGPLKKTLQSLLSEIYIALI